MKIKKHNPNKSEEDMQSYCPKTNQSQKGHKESELFKIHIDIEALNHC